MLKQQRKLINNLNHLSDFFLMVIALCLAYVLRDYWKGGLHPLQNYLWIIIVAFPVWIYLFKKHNLYASIRRSSLFDIAAGVINSHVFGGIFLGTVIFLVDKHFSRSLFLFFLLISLMLFVVERILLRLLLGYMRARGYNTRNLVIVGTRSKAAAFHRMIEDHSDWGLKIIGFVQVLDEADPETVQEHQVLGDISQLVEICTNHPVDEVVFCLPREIAVDADNYLKDLEELGITIRMVLDYFEVSYTKKELSMFHHQIPILTFHSKSFDAQQLFLKRALDILGGLVGLGILTFLFPFIALAIKIDSPGPIFFGQERMGMSGRRFKCWKFRSMYIDAEERKKELMAQNEMSGAIFKIKDDPRITKVGKFLRKTSLDELPQFWNVLRGEMSLVGTRPPTPDEVAQYENWHRRRISIKPGITGKWQVSGRNSIEDFDQIVRLDLDYIDKWSLWLDVKILLKTVAVVFARKGSC